MTATSATRWCPTVPCAVLCCAAHQVNLINANVDRISKRHLKQHPRVKAGAVWTRESQEWGGLAAELGLVDEYGMDDEPSDDDMGSDELEGGGTKAVGRLRQVQPHCYGYALQPPVNSKAQRSTLQFVNQALCCFFQHGCALHCSLGEAPLPDKMSWLRLGCLCRL